jgi:hypothetical protein
MLSGQEQERRAEQVSAIVGHRVRVVWQEPEWPPEWPEREPSWGIAVRTVGANGPCEVAISIDEEDEQDDAAWSGAARALRMAVTWEEAEARGEDPEVACANL